MSSASSFLLLAILSPLAVSTIAQVSVVAIQLNLPRHFQTLPLVIFQDACYSTNPNADEQHASYTSYFDQLPPWGQDDSDLDNRFDGCSPASVWYISRHGSRNPTEDEIFLFTDRGPEIRDQVLANHEEGRGEMCQEDLDLLGAW